MKRFIITLMVVASAAMVGCRKDNNPFEKYASAEFSFTFTEDRTYMTGQPGNYCSWNYSGGKIVSEKHPDEVFHFTNGNMVRIVAKSSDPSFQGVGVEAPEGVFCSHNNFDKAKGEDTWDLWKISKTDNWDDDATDGTVKVYCGDNVKSFPVKVCYNLTPKTLTVSIDNDQYELLPKKFETNEKLIEYYSNLWKNFDNFEYKHDFGNNEPGHNIDFEFTPGSSHLKVEPNKVTRYYFTESIDGVLKVTSSSFPKTISVVSKDVESGSRIQQVYDICMETPSGFLSFSFLVTFEL